MNEIAESLQEEIQLIGEKAPQFIYAFIVLLCFIIIGRMISAIVRKTIRRSALSDTYLSYFTNIISWSFGLVGIIVSLNILGLQYISASLLAGGGITAIVLGFAFRGIGENILAGLFLAFSRPFSIGDLIRSEGLEGLVKGVELRYTHIRTFDGCDIFIPSAQIFNSPLYNYTRDGLRRVDFTVGIDYGDDIREALEVLQETTERIDGILPDPKPAIHIQGFTANYVELRVFFWINTFDKNTSLLNIKTETMEMCRNALISNGFTFSSEVRTAIDLDTLRVFLERE